MRGKTDGIWKLIVIYDRDVRHFLTLSDSICNEFVGDKVIDLGANRHLR